MRGALVERMGWHVRKARVSLAPTPACPSRPDRIPARARRATSAGAPPGMASDPYCEHHGPRGDAAGAPRLSRKGGVMYARTTIIMADPARMDDGIADVRDNVMPGLSGMDGHVGVSLLCDRDSGRCIVTTAWETEEAMAATRDRVRQMRQRATEQFGGSDSEVQEWEIAVMHRAHTMAEGGWARVIFSRLREGTEADRVIDAWKAEILPRMDEFDGFSSVSLMVDRAAGRGVSTVCFDDRESMERSREMGDRMRNEFSGAMGVDITDVAEMEIAIHHLRVPEMA